MAHVIIEGRGYKSRQDIDSMQKFNHIMTILFSLGGQSLDAIKLQEIMKDDYQVNTADMSILLDTFYELDLDTKMDIVRRCISEYAEPALLLDMNIDASVEIIDSRLPFEAVTNMEHRLKYSRNPLERLSINRQLNADKAYHTKPNCTKKRRKHK